MRLVLAQNNRLLVAWRWYELVGVPLSDGHLRSGPSEVELLELRVRNDGAVCIALGLNLALVHNEGSTLQLFIVVCVLVRRPAFLNLPLLCAMLLPVDRFDHMVSRGRSLLLEYYGLCPRLLLAVLIIRETPLHHRRIMWLSERLSYLCQV